MERAADPDKEIAPFPEREERPIILVVDDDDALQLYIRTILEEDFTVLQALTEGQALNSLNDNPVDLVLLDLVLPKISGVSICRTIKERWDERRLPVIVLTARTDLESKVEALEAGADDYITKPFHQKELLTRIRVQLRIKDLHRELVKTERLKAIVETAISANHEINNPLCTIINQTELLMAMPRLKEDPEVPESLTSIMSNASRIEKTIKKMASIIQPAVTDYLPGVTMLDIGESKSGEDG